MPKLLFEELTKLPQVEAVAIGGSRAGEHYDEKSDYDVYVYVKEGIPEKVRYEILLRYCSRVEVGNHFWEYEDNCILKSGIDIDILYRDLDEFAKGIAETVEQFQACNGYTTCMWHNLKNCKILFDRTGRLTDLQKKYNIPYPEQLKQNIINHNIRLLRTGMPAYELQIAKAVKRGDLVSINHRVAEFMASYFDIIFALNGLTHPGEKRLMDLCVKDCKLLPADFKLHLEELFANLFTHPEQTPARIDRMIKELEIVLER